MTSLLQPPHFAAHAAKLCGRVRWLRHRHVDWTGDYSGNGAGVDASGDFTASGWLLGVTAGANMQMDNFVFGVEGDLAWANIEGAGPALDPGDANPSVPSGTVDWLGTLRARAGVAMDNVLLYGTAGFAFGGISSTITNADDPGVDLTAETTATGWTAGVGAEVALDDNVSVKAEYLYTSLSADDLDFGLTDSGELTSTSDYAAHTVRVGVNFAF